MIDVETVIESVRRSPAFCSVGKLHEQAERLSRDPRFAVSVAGSSVNGMPIHHVRFGHGALRALIVGGPHCMEPIGSLSVTNLLAILESENRALQAADVEWHVVPCIDPDGALLNEGWTLQPFAAERFLRNFYLQPLPDGVDTSFPIRYKRLAMDNQPSPEAAVLKGLIEKIQPDFFFPLHNTLAGGVFYLTSQDLGPKCYARLHRMLDRYDMPVRTQPQYSEFLAKLYEGVVENYSIRKHYDFFERTMAHPEEVFQHQGFGGSSWDYLEEIRPEALTFVAEMGYFRHPCYESTRQTGQNLRQFKLRIEADSKFLATVMLEEWENVKQDLNLASPFYKAMAGLALPSKARIIEGGFPVSRYPTNDTLFNQQYNRSMTEGEKFDACIVNDGLKLLAFNFQFLRLLRDSQPTSSVQAAAERLERHFAAAFADISRHFDLDAIEVFPADTLARVQLGSGLMALDALLETRGARR